MKVTGQRLSYGFGLMLFSQLAIGAPVVTTQATANSITPAASTEIESTPPNPLISEEPRERPRLKPIPPSLQSNFDSTGLAPGNPTRIETNNQAGNIFSFSWGARNDD